MGRRTRTGSAERMVEPPHHLVLAAMGFTFTFVGLGIIFLTLYLALTIGG